MSARIRELGDAADRATQRTADSDARGAGMRGRIVVATQYATAIDNTAAQLEAAVDQYERAMVAVSGGNIALIGRIEEDPSQPDAVDYGLITRRLAAQARESLESQRGMVESMREAARASRVMRQPTRRVIAALDRFAAATQLIDQWDRRLQALGVAVPPADWEPNFVTQLEDSVTEEADPSETASEDNGEACEPE